VGSGHLNIYATLLCAATAKSLRAGAVFKWVELCLGPLLSFAFAAARLDLFGLARSGALALTRCPFLEASSPAFHVSHRARVSLWLTKTMARLL
jgi:hypothetical protein